MVRDIRPPYDAVELRSHPVIYSYLASMRCIPARRRSPEDLLRTIYQGVDHDSWGHAYIADQGKPSTAGRSVSRPAEEPSTNGPP
jgi:hypothetical protein